MIFRLVVPFANWMANLRLADWLEHIYRLALLVHLTPTSPASLDYDLPPVNHLVWPQGKYISPITSDEHTSCAARFSHVHTTLFSTSFVHTGIFCTFDLDLHACHEVKRIRWVFIVCVLHIHDIKNLHFWDDSALLVVLMLHE